MGMPIVSTRVSGNIEAVIDGETGLVAEPDSGSLAAVINELLDRPEDWVRLGTAAQQRYRDLFDGEASVEKLFQLLHIVFFHGVFPLGSFKARAKVLCASRFQELHNLGVPFD